nr:MAG TPA: hypothetical protein [Caudoviricetes sp.]
MQKVAYFYSTILNLKSYKPLIYKEFLEVAKRYF